MGHNDDTITCYTCQCETVSAQPVQYLNQSKVVRAFGEHFEKRDGKLFLVFFLPGYTPGHPYSTVYATKKMLCVVGVSYKQDPFQTNRIPSKQMGSLPIAALICHWFTTLICHILCRVLLCWWALKVSH